MAVQVAATGPASAGACAASSFPVGDRHCPRQPPHRRETRQAQAAGSPRNRGIFDRSLLRGALGPAIRKMDLARSPGTRHSFEVTAALVTAIFLSDLSADPRCGSRGWPSPRASSSRLQSGCGSPSTSPPTRRRWPKRAARPRRRPCAKTRSETPPIAAATTARSRRSAPRRWRAGDVIVVREGETIPGWRCHRRRGLRQRSGHNRESGARAQSRAPTSRSSVTGGTTLTSDTLTICIRPIRETFLDRMMPLSKAQSDNDSKRDRPIDPGFRPGPSSSCWRRDPASLRPLRRGPARDRGPGSPCSSA